LNVSFRACGLWWLSTSAIRKAVNLHKDRDFCMNFRMPLFLDSVYYLAVVAHNALFAAILGT